MNLRRRVENLERTASLSRDTAFMRAARRGADAMARFVRTDTDRAGQLADVALDANDDPKLTDLFDEFMELVQSGATELPPHFPPRSPSPVAFRRFMERRQAADDWE